MLSRLAGFVDSFARNFTTVITIVIVVTVIMQVFCRYILGYSLAWSEELARNLLVWLVMIGVSTAFYKGNTIAVEFFRERFPEPLQVLLIRIENLFVMAFAVVIGYFGCFFAIDNMVQKNPVINISMGVLYLGILIGSIMIFIQSFVGLFMAKKRIESTQ
ncbi:TRAP transporter small permease [Ammoniphilus resinae]|uniref:TRAP-type C4-dicarboxylate transport system permease small subunit n=1 Tax=Ammoniphilus resinae TaxID=861532 RepID=A0ABS4GTT7_9BACL|nr:TRAP transporter small permease [Ammoniphilus resinae]MBP1933280.1 TRAP-type C4-dicarboxylate transport system permease small subunit [Ammoniphilus resinae]